MKDLDDTIAAIATAPGAAGLAVVRVSGPRALAVADALIGPGEPLDRAADHTLHHGWARWPGEPQRRIDEVVAGVFRAPRSYTREDVVELSCHGGPLSARRLLDALLAAGARAARPGEFTLRAFLNGRLDLAQAEAVADLIHAETEAARDLALAQLAGALSRRLAEIEEPVTDAAAEVEARVDFAEDVGGVEVPEHVREAIRGAHSRLEELLAGSRYARAVREGVRVPIVGRPNVGKSSLFNALLGEERAIVTSTPGTTRDRVSESIELAGVRVTLSDTAGLRRRGAGRAARNRARARALWPRAARDLGGGRGRAAAPRGSGGGGTARGTARPGGAQQVRSAIRLDRNALAERLERTTWRAVEVAAIAGDGLDPLREALADLAGVGAAGGLLGPVAAHPRHVEALERARAALARAGAASRDGVPGEIVALELREAWPRSAR